MKKTIAIIIFVLLLMTILFTGCSSQEPKRMVTTEPAAYGEPFMTEDNHCLAFIDPKDETKGTRECTGPEKTAAMIARYN